MPCPICEKETDQHYRPFCSRRCADIDLGRWVTESYNLPGAPEDPGSEDQDETRPQ